MVWFWTRDEDELETRYDNATSEQCLFRCRGAQNADTFRTAADGFREQLKVVAEKRRTIGTLLGQIVADAGQLHFAESAAGLAPMPRRTRSTQD